MIEAYWKVMYYGQKARNERLRGRLNRQRDNTARAEAKAEKFYNNYMAALDEAQNIKSSLLYTRCAVCGEEIVIATGTGHGLHYCPACGLRIAGANKVQFYTIEEGR